MKSDIIEVMNYTKVKRRNGLGKVYYKWVLVWNYEVRQLMNKWREKEN